MSVYKTNLRTGSVALAFAIASQSSISSMAQEITYSFNRDKVILPATEWTRQQYDADVMVINSNQHYSGAPDASNPVYNKVWGTPADDAQGRKWFMPDYELTETTINGSTISWQTARAPFSSDARYNDMEAFRWINVDIIGDIYLRRSFTLTESIEGAVYLSCGHDDAPAQWYINGVLVHSISDGWNNEEYLLLDDGVKSLIKTDGTENVMAVHVHQNWGGAYADCGLYEADMKLQKVLLNTVVNGQWSCLYYLLNNNDDIKAAEKGKWYALPEDENDWMQGVGPFSNDRNIFDITRWPSETHPILIRRHFNLSKDEVSDIVEADVTLTCSYDENPKIYLNGNLIWSANGWNDNNYGTFKLNNAQKKLLKEGDNVLCVSLNQGAGGGHIDYGLSISADYIPSGVSNVTEDHILKGKAFAKGVYNLSGQYLGEKTSALPSGFYIVDGKKKILK